MNIAIEKIDTNTEKKQIKKPDTNQEILENLNQEIIFQVRGEKQIDKEVDFDKEKAEAGSFEKLRKSPFMQEIETKMQNNEIERKIGRKIINVGIEILENIACYSTHNKAMIFQLIKLENKESQEISYKIRTRNYYKDPNGKKTADLEKRLKEGNELDLDQIKEKHNTQMANEGFNQYNKAGLGYLKIARTIKQEKINPFEYKFTIQKDGTVRFDLTLNIKQANK